MKKIVASVGLVALGVAGVNAEPAVITTQGSKPWSASLTLRGFYDDNINSDPSEITRKSAFGVEVSPSAALNWGNGPTTVLGRYSYSLKWYDRNIGGNQGQYSQQHLFDIAFGHAFSERYHLEVDDSFAIGQEPDVLRGNDASYTGIQTIFGNNIRNSGVIRFMAQLTPEIDLEIGYLNNFFDYRDNNIVPGPGRDGVPGTSDDEIFPSNSGVLDRIEQTGYITAYWEMTPETKPFVSYKFSMTDYTSGEQVGLSSTFDSTGTNFTDRKSVV